MPERLCCYVLVNSILSTMQKGVQAAHAVAELGYICHDDPQFIEWFNHHRTIVILEGGGFQDMDERLLEICRVSQERITKKPLCWSFFREDKNTFNDQVSAIAVILPNVKDRYVAMEGVSASDDFLFLNFLSTLRDLPLAR